MGVEPNSAASYQCPICREAVAGGAEHCAACGFHFEGGPGWPNPFSGRALGLLVGVFAAFYVLTVLVVLVAR